MKVLAIRHLKTPWNLAGKLQGTKDISIADPSEEDLALVNQNKKQLESLSGKFLVITSSLQRTQETAKIYGFDQFTVEPLVKELDFGKYEGTSKQEMIEQEPHWKDSVKSTSLELEVQDLAQRVEAFVRDYQKYERVLLFSHGAFIRALMAYAAHGDIDKMNQFEVPNNEIVEVEL